MRKKKNGQSGGAEDDKVDIEKDEDDEVGDPDEDEDDDGADGYDEEGDGDEEDDLHVDVDNDDDEEDEMSEERSAESLIEVRWSALKRQLDVKDAAAAADSTGQHLPVKKRMSRMRSNSFANGGGPSSRSGSSSSSSSSSFLDEPYTPQQTHQQPSRKRAPRLRSYSTSHCEPKPSAVAMNPEDYLGRTGAGNVLAARYSSPMRRGSRGFNSRANH